MDRLYRFHVHTIVQNAKAVWWYEFHSLGAFSCLCAANNSLCRAHILLFTNWYALCYVLLSLYNDKLCYIIMYFLSLKYVQTLCTNFILSLTFIFIYDAVRWSCTSIESLLCYRWCTYSHTKLHIHKFGAACLTYDIKKKLWKRTSIQRNFNYYDTYHCVFHIFLMSDGLAHCRLTSLVKIFEMIKQLFNVIFDIVIALRICIDSFAHAVAMETSKIFIRASSVFSLLYKSKIPRKCSICTCRINVNFAWQNVFCVSL